MSTDNTTLPTIGQFHKSIADSLNLFKGNGPDLNFICPPREKTRREALNKAFNEHKLPGNAVGPVDELIQTMQRLAPKPEKVERKKRSIQDSVLDYAKGDFSGVIKLATLTLAKIAKRPSTASESAA